VASRKRTLKVAVPPADTCCDLPVSMWARWDFHMRCLRVRLLTQRLGT